MKVNSFNLETPKNISTIRRSFFHDIRLDLSDNIWNILDNRTILSFSVKEKKFNKIKFDDVNNFATNYNKEGSIFINDKNGMFIITGSKYNLFYHYNKIDNRMIQLQSLKNNHRNGGLVIHSKSSSLICLSGDISKSVERYSDSSIIKGFNKLSYRIKPDIEFEWSTLPDLNEDRSNAGYIVVGDYIYSILGYSELNQTYVKTIERLDISKDYSTTFKWETITYNTKENRISDSLTSFVCIENKNEDEILIVGGINGYNNMENNYILSFGLTSKELATKCQFECHNFIFSNGQIPIPLTEEDNMIRYGVIESDDENRILTIEPSQPAFGVIKY